ncbi:hypothetical protein [Streptomyces sp. NPDC059957]|uniref:hypothetical protein n=1 Tax=unclassified Streptomyces TaxID=2593676 RepID=UPI003663D96B
MSASAPCLLVLAVVIAPFVCSRLAVEIVALGSALLVYAVGLISADQVFAGFEDPSVVYVAALFAVGAALREVDRPRGFNAHPSQANTQSRADAGLAAWRPADHADGGRAGARRQEPRLDGPLATSSQFSAPFP